MTSVIWEITGQQILILDIGATVLSEVDFHPSLSFCLTHSLVDGYYIHNYQSLLMADVTNSL